MNHFSDISINFMLRRIQHWVILAEKGKYPFGNHHNANQFSKIVIKLSDVLKVILWPGGGSDSEMAACPLTSFSCVPTCMVVMSRLWLNGRGIPNSVYDNTLSVSSLRDERTCAYCTLGVRSQYSIMAVDCRMASFQTSWLMPSLKGGPTTFLCLDHSCPSDCNIYQ